VACVVFSSLIQLNTFICVHPLFAFICNILLYLQVVMHYMFASVDVVTV